MQYERIVRDARIFKIFEGENAGEVKLDTQTHTYMHADSRRILKTGHDGDCSSLVLML